jgi:hypothetical protein
MLKSLLILLLAFAVFPMQTNAQAHEKQEGAADKQPAADTSPIAPQQRDSPKLQPEPDAHVSADVRVVSTPSKDRYDKAAFWANIILVGVGGAGVLVAVVTLLRIHNQAKEMKLQRIVMHNTLAAIKTQAVHMGEQTKILRDSVAAAQKSADAAKKSADAAMGVAIPTLMLHEFRFITDGCATAEAFFRHPKVVIAVKNFGQSPAFLNSFTVVFIRGELQPEPIYPHTPYPFEVEEVVESGRPRLLIDEPLESDHTFPEVIRANLISGTDHLIVYGYVCYRDIFGSPLRYMKFCKRLVEFDMNPKNMLVMDHGGYKYTGQHESYDPPHKAN